MTASLLQMLLRTGRFEDCCLAYYLNLSGLSHQWLVFFESQFLAGSSLEEALHSLKEGCGSFQGSSPTSKALAAWDGP